VRNGDFRDGGRRGLPETSSTPLLDGTKYLPGSVSSSNYGQYEDPEIDRQSINRMLRENRPCRDSAR